jgi:teichuronic acid exporter
VVILKELNLKQATLYNFISKYGMMIVQVGLTMVLARIILPEEFGVVAILTVLLSFFNLFADMGLGISIIQHPKMTKNEHNQLFSFSIIVGICLLLIMLLLAYPISIIYNNQDYLKMVPLISIAAFLEAINIIPNAILIRDKRFDIIAKRTIICTVITGSIAVGLAAAGFGAYALIIQSICSSLSVFVWNYINYPLRPSKFSLRMTTLLMGKYSLFQFLFNIINYFTRNLDNLVIGAKLGNVALGYYNRAYTLNLYPNTIFTSVITGVLHPYIRDYKKNHDELIKKLLEILKLLSIIGVFVMIVCYWCSTEIISIMFGANWLPAAEIFKMLSICIWAQMLSSVAGSVFLGVERTDQTFKCGLINLILIIGAITIGILNNNLKILSLSVSIAYNIIFLLTYYILIVKTLKGDFYGFIKVFVSDISCAAFFVIVVTFIPNFSNNVWVSLFAKTAICALYYLVYLLTSKKINILTNILKNVVRVRAI